MEKMRKCVVDKKEYEYCPQCDRTKTRETWRAIYCSENCKCIKEIFD